MIAIIAKDAKLKAQATKQIAQGVTKLIAATTSRQRRQAKRIIGDAIADIVGGLIIG